MDTKLRYKTPVLIAIISLILSVYTTSRAAGLSQAAPNTSDIPGRMQAREMNAAEPLILTDGQEEYPLGLHLEILEDVSGELTIEDVSSPAFDLQFTPSQVAVPNYGYTYSAYWVRLHIQNETLQTNNWLLDVGFPNTHYVDLYSPLPNGEGFTVNQSGVLRPPSTRDIFHPRIIFSLSIPNQSEQTIYLRFQSGASMTIPLTLWTQQTFLNYSIPREDLMGVYYGILIGLLVYNIFLLFSLKEKIYLYLALFLAAYLLWNASYDGYLEIYLFTKLYFLKPVYLLLFYCSTFVLVLLFGDTVLELKSRLPVFHWLVIILLVVWGILMFLTAFPSHYQNFAELMAYWGLSSVAVLLVGTIILWRRGYIAARFFMISWFGYLISMSLGLLVRLGLMHSNTFIENIFRVGAVWIAVGMSIALADRISLLKTQTENANRELKSSEHRLSQILESMPLGVVVYGKDQKPKYLNQRTVEILSNPAKGIQPDLAAERTMAQAIEYFSFRVAGTGEKYPLEDLPVYRALNGQSTYVDNIEADFGEKRVPLEIWASPVRDDAGNVESAIAVIQDVTQRKQVEAELNEYQQELESLVEKRTAGLNVINKELRQRLEWFAAINLFSQTAAQFTDFTKINEKVVEIINNLFEIQDSFIAEMDVHNNQLKILAHSCHSDLHPVLTGSFTMLPEGILPGSSLEQKTLSFLSRSQINSMDGPIGIHIRDSKVQSIALVPLRLHDQVLGFLGLEMSDVDRVFTEEESSLVSIFSTRIAQLIESARLFDQTKMLVAQEERDRLARELHDSVTQALFSANLVAEVLPQIWRRDPDRALQSLEKLQRLMRGALAEMRTVLLELRPSAVINTPLGELLAQLTESVTSRSGLPFQLFIEKIPLLPDDVQISFYRIAQEALNNVVKHAQARLVTVSLSETLLPPEENRQTSHEVRLLIQDDGVGFHFEDEQSGHLGINIMRERASAIQAALSLESEPGHGTRVSLIWRNESTSESDYE